MRRIMTCVVVLCFSIVPVTGGGLQEKAVRIERYHAEGVGSVNSFVLIGRTHTAIVDAQRSEVEATKLAERVRALDKPVQAIFITHEHPDHVGGLSALAQAFPHATIYASATTLPSIERSAPALVSRVEPPRDAVTLAGSVWTVEQLQENEAEGMTILVDRKSRTVILGDLVANGMTPWLGNRHVKSWLSQLRRAEKRFRGFTAYPGHGTVGSATALLGAQRQYLADFVTVVQKEVARSGNPLSNEAKARIRSATDAVYVGYLPVAPVPQLIEKNADAVARELATVP